jgi:hypothetical protein
MKAQLIHARDQIVKHGQKRATTVCFLRVPTARTVYLPSGLPFDCIGCRAIVAERKAEHRRAKLRLVTRFRQLWRRGQAARKRKKNANG